MSNPKDITPKDFLDAIKKLKKERPDLNIFHAHENDKRPQSSNQSIFNQEFNSDLDFDDGDNSDLLRMVDISSEISKEDMKSFLMEIKSIQEANPLEGTLLEIIFTEPLNPHDISYDDESGPVQGNLFDDSKLQDTPELPILTLTDFNVEF